MILGIGSDLVDIRRIEKVIQRYEDRFIDRIYTEVERGIADSRKRRIESYAKRFAAKEACAKALGTGISEGIQFREMGVVNTPSGQPSMVLTGAALKHLQRITPPGYEAHIHLTMTDDFPQAQAFVIISAVPLSKAC